MHQFLLGYSKSLADAIVKLLQDPSCKEVVFSNGSGVKLTRDDEFGRTKREKGAKCIGTHAYKDQTFLIFGP